MPGLLGEYAKGLLGFVSDPQSWKDMGTNAVGLLGAPLPSKQEALAMALRRRMQGSVMRDYPSAETDLANSYREKMQNVALGMNPVLATVWHGSPHKFDKFDMSKIGTGEGAQAYGYGLYFAENPATARTYSANREYVGKTMKGQDHGVSFDEKWIAQTAADEMGGADNAIKHLEMVLKSRKGLKAPGQAEENAKVQSAIDLLRSGSVLPKGNLYKVDLPDDQIAKMLDWDRPLSQQTKEVQKFFENHVAPIRQEMSKPAPGWGNLSAPTKYDPTGQELLALLRNRDANMTGLNNGLTSDISKSLYAAGIPGIRYLDGGSRGAGQGTSNFVVFDDKIPKILGRE